MINIDRHLTVNAGWFAGPAFGAVMTGVGLYLDSHKQLGDVLIAGGIAVFVCSSLVALSIVKGRYRGVTWPVILMCFGVVLFCIGGGWHFWPNTHQAGILQANNEKTKTLTPPTLQVSFSNKVDDACLMRDDCPYMSIVNIGSDGDLMANFVSRHTFRMSVLNSSRTNINDVEAYVIRITHKGGPPENTRIPLIVIPPGRKTFLHPNDTISFQFLEYIDEYNDGGLRRSIFIDKESVSKLKFLSKRGWLLSDGSDTQAMVFATPGLGHRGLTKPTVKGTDIYLDIAIYADDKEPTYARFSIDPPEPASVHLIEQGAKLDNLSNESGM